MTKARTIEYKHLQPRPLGRSEANDCAVRALANSIGLPYDAAHAELKAAGRPDRKGTPWNVCRQVYAKHGANERSFGFRRPTVAAIVREHQQGRYIVAVRGHVFALVDGVALDTFEPKPRQRVMSIFRMPEPTPPAIDFAAIAANLVPADYPCNRNATPARPVAARKPAAPIATANQLSLF